MARFIKYLLESVKALPDTVGFHSNIEKETLKNNNFRKVLYTTDRTQLVLMSLKPGEDIGEETHDGDQFFRVEKGQGKAVLNGNEMELVDGDSIVVPEGTRHNVINMSETEDLKLYTLYSPPQHEAGEVDKNKPEETEEVEESVVLEYMSTPAQTERMDKMFSSRRGKDGGLKLLWGWIKDGVVSFKEFKELIEMYFKD